jgi:integrase/recombinase XerD
VNALNAPLRDRLLAACPEHLPGLRDRVLIGLGYDTLCRSSELVDLLVEDLVDLPDGTGQVLVRHSKADPFGRGEVAFISAPTMADVRAWLDGAGLGRGPILRRFFRGSVVGKRMNVFTVSKIVKAAAERAGVEPGLVAGLSSHSLRIGAAQDLAIAGRSMVEIMRAGRWKHLDAVALYVRDAPVNVWARSDGDTYPVTQGARVWRGFRRCGKRPPPRR